MNKRFTVYGLRLTSQRGFTLIELLVVIAIIAVMIAFGVSNFLGARQRAKDVRIKSEFQQLKYALRLYYNDYTTYPSSNNQTIENNVFGCGADSPPVTSCQDACPASADGTEYRFATGVGCANVYMKRLPNASDYTWSYRKITDVLGTPVDDFCLWTTLENASDPEIARSYAKCQNICAGVVSPSDYTVCAD